MFVWEKNIWTCVYLYILLYLLKGRLLEFLVELWFRALEVFHNFRWGLTIPTVQNFFLLESLSSSNLQQVLIDYGTSGNQSRMPGLHQESVVGCRPEECEFHGNSNLEDRVLQVASLQKSGMLYMMFWPSTCWHLFDAILQNSYWSFRGHI